MYSMSSYLPLFGRILQMHAADNYHSKPFSKLCFVFMTVIIVGNEIIITECCLGPRTDHWCLEVIVMIDTMSLKPNDGGNLVSLTMV